MYFYALLYTPGVKIFLFQYLFLYIDTYTLLYTPAIHSTYTSKYITWIYTLLQFYVYSYVYIYINNMYIYIYTYKHLCIYLFFLSSGS